MKVRPSEIKWPKRIRQDFGDLTELRKSIAEDKLGAPITINQDRILVDGGRRLKAWKMEHGDEPVECFVYSGPLDPLVMEIKMEALAKRFTPDEIYEAGKMLEKHYKPKLGEPQRRGAMVKAGSVTALSSEEKRERTTDAQVAHELGIHEQTYQHTKRLFEPEAEEKVGKEKAEELRETAREKGIAPAYKALKKEEKKQKKAKEPPKTMPEMRADEESYKSDLLRAINLISEPPHEMTEKGVQAITKLWRKIIVTASEMLKQMGEDENGNANA